MRKRIRKALLLLAVLALVAAACGSSDNDSEDSGGSDDSEAGDTTTTEAGTPSTLQEAEVVESLKIGVLLPLTGFVSGPGEDAQQDLSCSSTSLVTGQR